MVHRSPARSKGLIAHVVSVGCVYTWSLGGWCMAGKVGPDREVLLYFNLGPWNYFLNVGDPSSGELNTGVLLLPLAQ